MCRLSIEDKENADKSKQASHVVNLVLPEVRQTEFLCIISNC